MKHTSEQVAVVKKKLYELNQSKIFIHKDYLLWLWFSAENKKNLSFVKTKDFKGLKIDLWIDNKIVFFDSLGQGHESHLKGGTPSHSEESTLALKSGKIIKELRLGVFIDGVGEFTLSLKSSDLNPKNIILPCHKNKALENSDHDLIDLRLYQLDILFQVLEELFAQFLQERSSSKWREKSLSIKTWISNRHKKRKHSFQ